MFGVYERGDGAFGLSDIMFIDVDPFRLFYIEVIITRLVF